MKLLTRTQLGIILSGTTTACATTFLICLTLDIWKKGIVASYVNMNALLAITLIFAVLAVIVTPDGKIESLEKS